MIATDTARGISAAPVVRDMKVVAVAGRDSMLLNLSGAHGPYFTRNIVILTDNAGHTGLGEVPGGETIRITLETPAHWSSAGRSATSSYSKNVEGGFPTATLAGGLQTFDLRTTIHVTAIDRRSTCWGSTGCAGGCVWRGQQRDRVEMLGYLFHRRSPQDDAGLPRRRWRRLVPPAPHEAVTPDGVVRSPRPPMPATASMISS